MKRLPATVEDLAGLAPPAGSASARPASSTATVPTPSPSSRTARSARLGLVDSGLAWRPPTPAGRSTGRPRWRTCSSAARRALRRPPRRLRLALAAEPPADAQPARGRPPPGRRRGVLLRRGDPVVVASATGTSSSTRPRTPSVPPPAAAADPRGLRREARDGARSRAAARRSASGATPAKLLEPDPERLAVVVRAFELAAGRTRPTARSPRRVGLPLFTVRGMLTSPLYVGRLRTASRPAGRRSSPRAVGGASRRPEPGGARRPAVRAPRPYALDHAPLRGLRPAPHRRHRLYRHPRRLRGVHGGPPRAAEARPRPAAGRRARYRGDRTRRSSARSSPRCRSGPDRDRRGRRGARGRRSPTAWRSRGSTASATPPWPATAATATLPARDGRWPRSTTRRRRRRGRASQAPELDGSRGRGLPAGRCRDCGTTRRTRRAGSRRRCSSRIEVLGASGMRPRAHDAVSGRRGARGRRSERICWFGRGERI